MYVAQGNGGLLKIGVSKDVSRRVYQLRGEFKERGDELSRIESCGPLDYARGCEYSLQALLAKTNLRHSGREWFIDGDFDLALREAKRLYEKAAAEEAYWKSPKGIQEKAERKAEWAAEVTRREAAKAQVAIWCEEARLARERKRAERQRRRDGAFPMIVAHLTA